MKLSTLVTLERAAQEDIRAETCDYCGQQVPSDLDEHRLTSVNLWAPSIQNPIAETLFLPYNSTLHRATLTSTADDYTIIILGRGGEGEEEEEGGEGEGVGTGRCGNRERVRMAKYRGWDHDEMSQAGNEMKEHDTNFHVVPSFTPINQSQTHPTTITRQQTLLTSSLDSDSLYDLREDIVTAKFPVKSRKRPAVSKGRHVGFTRLWEYEDDGDLAHHNNGPDFEEFLPKQKKTAPKKRSQSMKVPAKTSNQAWEHHEGNDETGEGGSQLSTPPDSRSRAKGRIGSLPSQGNAKAKKVFQNTAVTRPSSAKEKRVVEPSDTEPIKSYQGLKTTEEMVSSALVSLSKTTLDKFASFRYQPTSTVVAGANISKRIDLPAALDLQPHREVLPTFYSPSPGQDHIPSSQSFFGQATWYTGMGDDDHLSNEQVGCMPIKNPMLVSKAHGSHKVTGMPRNDHGSLLNITKKGGHQPIPQAQPQAIVSNASQDPSHDPRHLDYEDGYDEPTSSESLLLLGLLASVDVGIAGNFGQGAPFAPDMEEDILCRLYNSGMVAKSGDGFSGHTTEFGVDVSIEPNDGSYFVLPESPVAKVLKSELATVSDLSHLDDKFFPARSIDLVPRRYQVDVMSSDLDDYEAVPSPSKDFYETDEFEEGLDDDDLLAIIPDLAVLKTPLEGLPTRQRHAPANPPSATQPAMLLESTANRKLTLNRATPITNANSMSYTSHPQIIQSGFDDEFPMNDDDEEEMLKLPELRESANEGFIPPAIVQELFDDDYQYARVFNENPHFSPPSSLAKLPEIHDTDTSRPIRHPRKKVMFCTSPAIEEEDWSFICTDDHPHDAEMQNMHDIHANPPPVVKQRIPFNLATSSPVKCTMSMISKAPTCATQVTVGAAILVIDDSHEYELLLPFARPEFPALVMDRCPVIGLSAHIFLRTCFRVGEMFRAGLKCYASGLDAVIELFARVNFSSRESGTTKQHFQFLDLWHDRPPYPSGILASFKTSGLADTESKVFLTGGEKKMARALGRMKKSGKNGGGSWWLEIINIRETDWEEIRWTKRIVSGDDLAKREKGVARGDVTIEVEDAKMC